MELFELTKIMFEDPQSYSKIPPGEKRKHFFMINRRMSIQFPLQSQSLQRLKIDEVSVIDFWQRFLRQQYTKTPFWMYTKGSKKITEEKEKTSTFKETTLKSFSLMYGYDIKMIKEALEFFPNEMKKELNEHEKMIQ